MKYKGKIENINHIVISDPTYERGTWCRYEKVGLKEKDWSVDINTETIEREIYGHNYSENEFSILLKKDNEICSFEDNKLNYKKGVYLKKYEIGIDTACIALGINRNANEIIESKDEWQPDCAIRTGSDGIFREVIEGLDDNKELQFVLIYGSFDNELCDENELIDYLEEQFEITELSKIMEANNEL